MKWEDFQEKKRQLYKLIHLRTGPMFHSIVQVWGLGKKDGFKSNQTNLALMLDGITFLDRRCKD